MNNKSVWIIAGALVGGALLGAAHLSAQKPDRGPEGPKIVKPTGGQVVSGFAQVGRYTVVKHDAFNNIVLLDTTTGDIYKATPDDFKKYADRPTGGGGFKAPPIFKDGDKKEDLQKKRVDEEKNAIDRERAARERAAKDAFERKRQIEEEAKKGKDK